MAQTMPLKFIVLFRQSCLCECRLSSMARASVRNLHVRQKIRHRFSCVETVFQATSRIVKLLPLTPPQHPFAHFHFPADECTPLCHLLLFSTHVPCTLVPICIPCIPLKPLGHPVPVHTILISIL